MRCNQRMGGSSRWRKRRSRRSQASRWAFECGIVGSWLKIEADQGGAGSLPHNARDMAARARASAALSTAQLFASPLAVDSPVWLHRRGLLQNKAVAPPSPPVRPPHPSR